MDFLLYLTEDSREILALLQKAQVTIRENTSICRNSDLFGNYSADKQLVICTNNIRKSGHDPEFYVNETLIHEAVHAAQQCRGGPFWISKTSMPLPWNKLNDIKRSTLVGKGNSQIEHEAYWMEDKPNKVKYVIRKFCF